MSHFFTGCRLSILEGRVGEHARRCGWKHGMSMWLAMCILYLACIQLLCCTPSRSANGGPRPPWGRGRGCVAAAAVARWSGEPAAGSRAAPRVCLRTEYGSRAVSRTAVPQPSRSPSRRQASRQTRRRRVECREAQITRRLASPSGRRDAICHTIRRYPYRTDHSTQETYHVTILP